MDQMSEKQRWILFFAIAMAVIYFYSVQTQKRQLAQEQERQKEALAQQHENWAAQGDGLSSGVLTISDTGTTVSAPQPAQRPAAKFSAQTFRNYPGVSSEETIHVHTKRLDVTLTNRGGRPLSWRLLLNGDSSVDLHNVELIPQRTDPDVIERPLEVMFKKFDDNYGPLNQLLMLSETTESEDGETTTVRFLSAIVEGVQLEKIYRFHQNSWLTELDLRITNHSPLRLAIGSDGGRGVGLSWGPGLIDYTEEITSSDKRYFNVLSMTGDKLYYKTPKPEKDPLEIKRPVSWGGLESRFFGVFIIPRENPAEGGSVALVRSRNMPDEEDRKNFIGLPVSYELYSGALALQPAPHEASAATLAYQLFTGPKDLHSLGDVNETLDDFAGKPGVIDLKRSLFASSWNWMRFLCLTLYRALNKVNEWTGSWGLAIILLTVLVRLITHPLSHKAMKEQAKAMESMKLLKPQIDAINEKYKNDPGKKQTALMEMYKKNGVNPFAQLKGCLPMFIQFPIFIALYYMLNQSIKLRGAEFMFIRDLSQPDHLIAFATMTGGAIKKLPWLGEYFNILPILWGLTQFSITKFTSQSSLNQDPNQKIMMYMFPIVFPVLLYTMPSGLMLYWLVSNIWQFGHQIYAKRAIHQDAAEA
ncbi:membrane protein insertase YidC [Candidatus Sumerlaeota bacterium]|nr:membrane protein insertase YidC [Candidatus Sumerlaeota bacterium]